MFVDPRHPPPVRAILRLAALLLLLLGFGTSVAAQDLSPDAMQSGSLLMRTREGGYEEMVRLGTDVDLTVSGPTVRARVTQVFRNPSRHWAEAVYVYPLPEDGAVDGLKMVVGRRVIVGEIRKKAEAQAMYEQAKAKGQKAALLEQQRSDVFTNSVANIGPGETVLVQIEYQAPVRQDAGVYSLRVPLVVAPRYSPGVRPDGSDPAPDRATFDKPVFDPRQTGPLNPVTISVHLKAGFALGPVTSAYHRIDMRNERDGGRTITLADRQVPANRDFQLSWRPATAATPQARLFHERVGGEDYVMAVITPPTVQQGPRLPREMIFVIDNSGSMGGESIRQAKAGLLYGLSRLQPGDVFNVVRFDDTLTKLFPDTVPADAAHLAKARAYVNSLDAAGGTEMLPAMKAALADPRPTDRRFVRQVVFMTDGEITDEAELFGEIGRELGRSRLYMVGIGSAPNSALMTRGAELGRGAFTHIGEVTEVQDRMRELFGKLESPVATDLKAEILGVQSDVTPASMPDLYRGEPVVLSAWVGAMHGSVRITGRLGGKPWALELPLKDAVPGTGLSKLWARRRISDAEVEQSLNKISAEQADTRILALATEHGLVSSQTSLVAVDHTPSRPAGEPLHREDLPLDLPAGWDFDALFGHQPADGDKPQGGKAVSEAGVDLPQTATDAALLLEIGAVLAFLGAGGLLFARRSRGERGRAA